MLIVIDLELLLLLAVSSLLAVIGVGAYIKARIKYRLSEVDSILRSELYGKIDDLYASLSSKVSELDGKLNSKVSELDGKLNSKVSELDGKLNSTVSELDGKLNSKVKNLKQKVDTQLSVDRVADVEQLAICSGLLAAKACLNKENETFHLSSVMHGHASMMEMILLDRAAGIIPEYRNGCHIIEIGTTREKQWAQMSTSRLALVGRAFGYKMISVDIDPENTKSGNEVKSTYGNVITAITDSGENFLQQWEGELPRYIYIDAYDFDHGNHSEQRQERYRRLQGSNISDEACWNMHLDCAVEFVRKCPQGGIVVFDDVFNEHGEWLGKGKTAVPYVLDNGFEMVTRTSKTVVFKKS